jgi:hypothetical protein
MNNLKFLNYKRNREVVMRTKNIIHSRALCNAKLYALLVLYLLRGVYEEQKPIPSCLKIPKAAISEICRKL